MSTAMTTSCISFGYSLAPKEALGYAKQLLDQALRGFDRKKETTTPEGELTQSGEAAGGSSGISLQSG
jgi:hypothetical protein